MSPEILTLGPGDRAPSQLELLFPLPCKELLFWSHSWLHSLLNLLAQLVLPMWLESC